VHSWNQSPIQLVTLIVINSKENSEDHWRDWFPKKNKKLLSLKWYRGIEKGAEHSHYYSNELQIQGSDTNQAQILKLTI
jgi:hypothetical protein